MTAPAQLDGRPIAGLTIDAMGCLVTLRDPTPALARLLAAHGAPRPDDAIGRALRREIAYYKAHHLEGRGTDGLRDLRERCVAELLDDLAVPRPLADEAGFVAGFLEALAFAPLPGVAEALVACRAAGLRMVCVSNWDDDLPRHLERLGLAPLLDGVVTSADAGAAKPDPRIFARALARLELPAATVAHLGDEPVDRDGAAAAGLAFLDPPVATLPERLGLR
ncbi:HAD-IA family hydrolase [Patulibacter defluvii]|uniref:HAD-IA family hydrolase n=1 Tax=Patulibacter defluvii TaxID=3095358 RepID=UPI002A758FB1|nr:HAD-IA family hydrolase [Patulibacter sp. DM4]